VISLTRQLPITTVHEFADYRTQGQTITVEAAPIVQPPILPLSTYHRLTRSYDNSYSKLQKLLRSPSHIPRFSAFTVTVSHLLHNSAYHLSTPSLLENVKWVHTDKTLTLVAKRDHNNTTPHMPAPIEYLGDINHRPFTLLPCALWNASVGPTKPAPFKNAKAQALICAPRDTYLTSAWSAYINNLDLLVNFAYSVAGLEQPPGPHQLVDNMDNIKLSHSIFVVCYCKLNYPGLSI
jgi:hypothetical protein